MTQSSLPLHMLTAHQKTKKVKIKFNTCTFFQNNPWRNSKNKIDILAISGWYINYC